MLKSLTIREVMKLHVLQGSTLASCYINCLQIIALLPIPLVGIVELNKPVIYFYLFNQINQSSLCSWKKIISGTLMIAILCVTVLYISSPIL
ncbi:hypothetical protein Sjap_009405 [Stephania japonica]|uniref:Uncharacterized protein n=1 Tax=Stephania japonica TaxID=461633 RepID=A0AAP0JRY9_9MAGN